MQVRMYVLCMCVRMNVCTHIHVSMSVSPVSQSVIQSVSQLVSQSVSMYVCINYLAQLSTCACVAPCSMTCQNYITL
jgi:hypothetical protein